MTDDLDDLLGETAPPAAAPRRARLSEQEAAAKLEAAVKGGPAERSDTLNEQQFFQPVTAAFLAKVFRKTVTSVLRLLADCPPKDEIVARGGHRLMRWDFVEASAYLVEPKVDLLAYLKTLNSNNIPPWLNKTVWDAENAKLKWLQNALHLWRDEDVLEVLGTTAIKIRERSMLWVDELPDKLSLSDENDKSLRGAVADLLEEIKKDLIEMPKQRRSGSIATTMGEILYGDRASMSEEEIVAMAAAAEEDTAG